MKLDDHATPPPPTPGGPSRRVASLAAVALLLVIAVVAVLVIRSDGDAVGSSPSASSPPQSTSSPSTTTVDARTEVVARLREILRVRDRAFHERDADLLDAVYTVDCPCLEGDTNAIKELARKRYRLIGGATSIRVRRTERVNGRLWLVIADFRSTSARIETEDGVLVRQELAGSDLFQFALAKPVDAAEWQLGRATSYRNG
jgi:hypothetical protein